jgi:cytochrome P450
MSELFLGKVCLSWIETRPRLIIGDPELIRLILADKNGEFVFPPLNPLVKILQQGVATLQGERWAKRRRLITPAFHFEKLKVT